MKKVKILTVSSSGFNAHDGIGTVLYDYYKRFDLERFELHLAVAGRYKQEFINKFECIGVVPQYLPSRSRNTAQYFFSMIRLIADEKYDVIYVHGSSAILSIDLLAAKLSGCKCRVVHSHNTMCDHKKLDMLLRPILYSLYTEAFACGNDAGRWLFGDRPFQIIRNGRSIPQYRYNAEVRVLQRKKLAINDDCLAIGHVGSFNEQKNQEFLVRVFYELQKKEPNAKLFLIGDGVRRKAVEEAVKKLELQKKVVFLGVTGEVNKILQAMDIMTLPSLYEGLPLVVVEWQLAGLPCLISDCVTRECVFTDLVEFEAVENNSAAWVEHLLSMRKISIARDDLSIVKGARNAGYDIDIDAVELQNLFLKMVPNQRNIDE